MANPRAEAAERAGAGFDPRVLEPSPPASTEPPAFADDPLEGGDLLPVVRGGARTWEELCGRPDGSGGGLRAWCEDRWLVRRAPVPLPDGFAATRRSLHALAEHVLAPCRHAANGRIGLRFTYHGFGTPFFGADRQVRVEDGELVDDRAGTERRAPITTLREAAAFLGSVPGAPAGVYTPTTPFEPDAPLVVDRAAAAAVGDWFGLAASVLEQLRADAGAEPGGSPSRVQLWPEHFDLAVDLGPDGRRANYGASPGDEAHPEPYVYVGPWDRAGVPDDPFWNEPFGASLPWSAVLDGHDPLAFVRRGKELLAS